MRRQRVALLAGIAGLALLLRTKARPQEPVALYYDDGSVVTLADDDAEPLVAVARSALDATRA